MVIRDETYALSEHELVRALYCEHYLKRKTKIITIDIALVFQKE